MAAFDACGIRRTFQMNNVKQAKQFETTEQIGKTLAELDCSLADATAAVDRLSRLRSKLASEFAELKNAADDLDFQSEKEFADSIGIEESLLAKLRRDLDLPHSRFGREPKYTKEQRRRVAQILEISNSRKGASRLRAA
jgi:hypothetical protein